MLGTMCEAISDARNDSHPNLIFRTKGKYIISFWKYYTKRLNNVYMVLHLHPLLKPRPPNSSCILKWQDDRTSSFWQRYAEIKPVNDKSSLSFSERNRRVVRIQTLLFTSMNSVRALQNKYPLSGSFELMWSLKLSVAQVCPHCFQTLNTRSNHVLICKYVGKVGRLIIPQENESGFLNADFRMTLNSCWLRNSNLTGFHFL